MFCAAWEYTASQLCIPQGQVQYKATDIPHRHDDPRNGSKRNLIKRCTTQIQGLRPPSQPQAPDSGPSDAALQEPGDANVDEAEEEEGNVQDRLPGADWREQHGAAGVQADKRRSSPIVELSLLLVRPPNENMQSSRQDWA